MSARVLGTSESDLNVAARILRDGGLVALPTETVYGLGANAFDVDAVARVFEAKARPHFDPLIVHIGDREQLSTVAKLVSPLAQKLIDAFWPGPLTLVLPKTAVVPSLVTSGLDTVAVRMPAHSVARELIKRAGVPVAAPSANRFGRLSPTRSQHVETDLGDVIDAIVDGGASSWGLESTIVEVSADDRIRILRHGAIAKEEIQATLDAEVVEEREAASVNVPGQLAQHYAPTTKLVCVGSEAEIKHTSLKAAFLGFSEVRGAGYEAQQVLSPEGDLREAAANLFDALHVLDGSDADVIYAEIVPEEGVGRAINDRLRRAAATWH